MEHAVRASEDVFLSGIVLHLSVGNCAFFLNRYVKKLLSDKFGET